jgi:hypothetical protein
MPPIPLPIERSDLENMKKLQVKNHADWPAVFSTNSDCEIWCYCRFGNTPRDERVFVQGELEIIDFIAKTYRYERPNGGRFFISDAGVFHKEENCEEIQIIEFRVFD